MTIQQVQSWGRLVPIRTWLLLLSVAAVGCGGVGDLSGTVTFRGKPVVVGQVMVVGRDGVNQYGDIDTEGNYRVSGVPTGEAKIVVSSPKPGGDRLSQGGRGGRGGGAAAGGGGGGGGKAASIAQEQAPGVDPELLKKWIALPPEVGDPTQTPLTVTVKRGQNAHDIEVPDLKPETKPEVKP